MRTFKGDSSELGKLCENCGLTLGGHSAQNNSCPALTRDTEDTVPVTRHDLRGLLFWAAIGVSQSEGGSYANDIEEMEGDPGIIKSYADHIKFILPAVPKFKERAGA